MGNGWGRGNEARDKDGVALVGSAEGDVGVAGLYEVGEEATGEAGEGDWEEVWW